MSLMSQEIERTMQEDYDQEQTTEVKLLTTKKLRAGGRVGILEMFPCHDIIRINISLYL